MRRLPSKKFFLTTVAIVALVVVAGAAVAAGQDSRSGYRTATASSRSVEQTLDEVGTIAPTSQATVGFPIAGTVSTVDVALGDTVTAGQVLATLDTASLEADVRTAQAALDRAELTLEQAEEGETVTGGGGGGGATIAASTSAGDVTFQLIATTGPDDTLTAARQAVLQAKQQVDAYLLAAHEALDSATAICGAADASACTDALDAALAAQQKLADSQQALNEAATAFDELLAQRAADTPSPDTPPPDPSTPPTTDPSTPPAIDPSTPPTSSPPEGGDTPSNGSAPATNSPSSEDLIAYQAAIDAADIDVTVAEEALQQARIVAPIDGTVVTLDLAAGQEVSAASDTDVVVVAGTGGYEVTATVSVTDLPDLEVGQPATIRPDGTNTTLTGEIVDIGLVATSGTSGTTYPVTISIEDASDGLRNGSVASVAIVVDEAEDVLSVPTTAVHNEDGTYTVTMLDGDTADEVTVEVGAVGPAWTEIRSGLEPGTVVVVADLDEPLPSSANDGSTGGPQNPFGDFRGPPEN